MLLNNPQGFGDIFTVPIEVTITSKGQTGVATYQFLDGGFRALQFVPRIYVSNKYILETDPLRDLVTVFIQDMHAQGKGSSLVPHDVWTLGRLHDNPLWTGQYFREKRQYQFTFVWDDNITLASLLTGPMTIGLDIVGLIGPEDFTLDYIRQFTGAPGIAR